MKLPGWRRREEELDKELQSYYESAVRVRLERGETEEQARVAARRELGNTLLIKEVTRDIWGWTWLRQMGQDGLYALRIMRKSPVFTGVIVLSLALAIGATTAIFSLVNAVLLKTLPVKNPSELVLFGWTGGPKTAILGHSGSIRTDQATRQRRGTSISYPAFERMQAQNQTLTDLFAFVPIGANLNLSADHLAGIASGQFVSGGYYRGLGVSAVVGRTIDENDDRIGAEPVAVITYRYWKERFALDSGVVGKSVNVDGLPFTIIGVTTRDFDGVLDIGQSAEVSLPLATVSLVRRQPSRAADSTDWWLRLMGRLKPGISINQARANLEPAVQQSAMEGLHDYLAKNPNPKIAQMDVPPTLTAVSGSRGLVFARQDQAEQLYILLAVVGLVMLIASVNTANLLLARASARQKEMAVRTSLGAGRSRLIRQLLTESLILAIIGGLAGVILAFWLKNFLVIVSPFGGEPLKIDLNLDLRVLGFATAVSLVTGILFGIAPALAAAKIDPGPVLKKGTQQNLAGGRLGLGKALVVVQVALSVLVLVGAGLFIRTLRNLQHVDYGFDASNILLFKVNPALNGYKYDSLANLYQRITDRISAIPGVRVASLSMESFMSGDEWTTEGVKIPGAKVQPDENASVYLLPIKEDLLDVMRIPVVLGRNLNSADVANSTPVAVVSQAFVRLAFKDENPIGRLVSVQKTGPLSSLQIVGVARDVRYDDLRSDPPPMVYLPYQQQIKRMGSVAFEVSANGDPNALVSAIRQAVQSVDSNLPITDVRTQAEQIDQVMGNARLFADFSAAFGALALLLACLGLYGVMSYSVARRTGEIGIRMALGAEPGKVLRLIMGEALLLVIIGGAVGVSAAIATTRLLASFLFGLRPSDPFSIGFAIVVLLTVAVAASYLPARRAAGVDPLMALRYD